MTIEKEIADLLSTQELDIYGTALDYDGPVRILHGNRDKIVPMWCSEKYRETQITNKRPETVRLSVDFFKTVCSLVNSPDA